MILAADFYEFAPIFKAYGTERAQQDGCLKIFVADCHVKEKAVFDGLFFYTEYKGQPITEWAQSRGVFRPCAL